jgi:uncharacterized protein YbbC (DUF1343 family)
MRFIFHVFLFFFTSSWCISCHSNNDSSMQNDHSDSTAAVNIIITGAGQTTLYFPLIENKKIAIVTNQTGMIGNVHLIDSLVHAGFDLQIIFAPEHGFRGHAEAGEKVSSDIDRKTGIKIISLYGSNFKPKAEEMKGFDIMIFDIQDVGVRFYTYISTMHYVMEACAEAGIPLIILDRPNPNGFYVDGPILQPEFKSFIGMHPIPVVHGLTVGELALMINGEGWLQNGLQCELTVIPVKNYSHKTLYQLPVAPSPNLPSMASVYLYPSLCFFEGTVMSVGRGTDFPFEIFGHPLYPAHSYSFTPVSKPGYALKPPFMNQTCYGLKLTGYADTLKYNPRLELKWLIDSYRYLGDKTTFFNPGMFDKLAGTDTLRKQVFAGKSEAEIRTGWQKDIEDYLAIRKKYLLYEDF